MPERLRPLFVCYANADRSPTAEAVCRKIAADNDLEIEAGSAGVSRGANRPVTKEMADLADKIFVREDWPSTIGRQGRAAPVKRPSGCLAAVTSQKRRN